MKRFIRRFYLVYLVVGTYGIGTAQVNDAELWTGAGISKKITKKLSLHFEEQVRMNDNITSVKNFFSELGTAYRLNKYFKVSGYYRFKNIQRLDGTYRVENRFHGDIRVRYKAKPIIVLYRARIQVEYGQRNKGPRVDYYDRNKLTVKLDLDKMFRPFFSSEVYLDIKGKQFDKVRYTLGCDLELSKRHEAAFFYRIQRQFNVKNPTYSYIVGLGYAYKLKGRLIKKKPSESEQ
ncbi:MAG: hypothetical protein COB85_01745 [Bacteroidetes bacterium]|nr:MAG: hypothetical protein COB85_01745 [Bacteroidota bacterium]